MKAKPNISKVAFWDVDFDRIDYEKESIWVIGKVLNDGLWEDVLELFQFYGVARIKKEIVQIPYLNKRVLQFWSSYFQIKENEFKCFKKKQSMTVPWEF